MDYDTTVKALEVASTQIELAFKHGDDELYDLWTDTYEKLCAAWNKENPDCILGEPNWDAIAEQRYFSLAGG